MPSALARACCSLVYEAVPEVPVAGALVQRKDGRLEARMAEIKVEPKRGGLGWLLAIIVIALIAAAFWYFMNNSRSVPATTAPADSARTSMLDQPSTNFARV